MRFLASFKNMLVQKTKLKQLAILALSSLSFSACIGPKLTVCIVDVNGLPCHDSRTNKDFIVPVQEASDKNFVAMPPEDYAKLLDFIKNKCR